jgi:oligopeptide transport system substrate-binding protein
MPISARAFLMFPVSLSVAFLVACRGGETKGPKPLILAQGAEPSSLDPHAVTGIPEIRVIGSLFEGLVVRGLHDTKVRPGAASSWEVSPDAKTYTFRLRSGARWSDGSPFTSRDFLKSWRRFADPATASEYITLLKIIRNADAVREKRLPPDSLGISAPDDTTFIVNLEFPVGFFLDLCSFEPFAAVPVDTIAKHKEKWTEPGKLVGTGPFRLDVWKHNVEVRVSKNPFYWDSANVKQAAIVFNPVEDQLTAYNMFQNRELDWIFSIPPSKLEGVKKSPEFFNQPMFGTYFYIVNCKNPGYSSKDLRKALSYAIDRKKITERVLKGVVTEATGFVPPTPGYSGVGMQLYDPVKAKEFLAKSGYGPGKQPPELQILFNTLEAHRDIAQVVAQMWKEVLGLDAELVNYEWKVYLENTKNLNYKALARQSWIGDFTDPISFLELYTTTDGNNRTGFSDPAYDEAVKATWTIPDPATRMAKLKEAEGIMMEGMPVIPIYYYALQEMRNPKLQNAVPNPLGQYTWKDIYLAP